MSKRTALTVDVLVIGARCAGAATAMLLARHGLSVLMADRGGYGTDTLSTHALMRGGVLQLHRWGLLDRVKAMNTPAIRRTEFHYGEEVLDIEIAPAHGTDALYAPRRMVLDSILVDAAQEVGVQVRHHHTLTALLRNGNGRVTGGILRDEDGREVAVSAGLVIGADGIGSAVARLAGAPVEVKARHASAVIYGYFAGLSGDAYRWFYRPNVSAGVIPTTAGRACVFASMPPGRFKGMMREGADAGFNAVLAESAPDLPAEMAARGARLEGRLMAFAGRKGFLRRAHGPGWALVGDAGYFKDPLTAHGITDAFRDAELLARAAAVGTDAALAGYQETRDALSRPLFEVTDAVASFNWTVPELKALHIGLNKAMKAEVAHMLTWPEVPVARRMRPSIAPVPA